MRACWNLTYWIFFRPFIGPIFWRWRNCVLRLWGAKIGRNSKISASVKIWAPWNLEIGRYTAIGAGVNCYNPGKILLGNRVVLSQRAYLCTASHDIQDAENHLITSCISVGSFAWIASEAFVGMGVTIGEGAVVGARAAVFKDVEPWTVVGGNPAKVLKKRMIRGEVETE